MKIFECLKYYWDLHNLVVVICAFQAWETVCLKQHLALKGLQFAKVHSCESLLSGIIVSGIYAAFTLFRRTGIPRI